MKNIVYLDLKTNQIKTSTFAKFDEAHFSYENKPPGAKILIEMGMRELHQNDVSSPSNTSLGMSNDRQTRLHHNVIRQMQ